MYLKPNEWVKLFKECGYTGYYDFTILKKNKLKKIINYINNNYE